MVQARSENHRWAPHPGSGHGWRGPAPRWPAWPRCGLPSHHPSHSHSHSHSGVCQVVLIFHLPGPAGASSPGVNFHSGSKMHLGSALILQLHQPEKSPPAREEKAEFNPTLSEAGSKELQGTGLPGPCRTRLEEQAQQLRTQPSASAGGAQIPRRRPPAKEKRLLAFFGFWLSRGQRLLPGPTRSPGHNQRPHLRPARQGCSGHAPGTPAPRRSQTHAYCSRPGGVRGQEARTCGHPPHTTHHRHTHYTPHTIGTHTTHHRHTHHTTHPLFYQLCLCSPRAPLLTRQPLPGPHSFPAVSRIREAPGGSRAAGASLPSPHAGLSWVHRHKSATCH